jgi:hypothetical protein
MRRATPGCDRWTAGLWTAVLRDFNDPGVQMAVTLLEPPADRRAEGQVRPPDAEKLFAQMRGKAGKATGMRVPRADPTGATGDRSAV